ncbi:MAG: AAA family ATPase [Gammaproteobacteria bacterium]
MSNEVVNINDWRDFNSAAPQQQDDARQIGLSVEEIKVRLNANLRGLLSYLYPAGVFRHGKFLVGDVRGNKGESLSVELSGPKAGMWHDFATGEGGDVLALWAAATGRNTQSDFPSLLDDVRQWLGEPRSETVPVEPKRTVPMDELGPVTAKWDYVDGEGALLACVYRYDPPSGKQFRPWDVSCRKMRAPDPRPLYNQPAMKSAMDVVLVEGEKAADALIGQGVCATTAMNGAKAPVEKTDWSPLCGKRVLIWPDKDAAGWQYAEAAAEAALGAGAFSVTILMPPLDKPEKWDAADAVDDGMDIDAFIANAPRQSIVSPRSNAQAFSLKQLLGDHSPMPDDIIAPRVLTPSGLLVFGGAPKVGKSDFLLCWLVHMAAGIGFLSFMPPRPLRVFYLQAEIQYHYLRERLQDISLQPEVIRQAHDNLVITPQLKLILNEAGVETVGALIRKHFPDGLDIIVIDPIRNVFDGGEAGPSENDNNAMLFFLRDRVEKLRDAVDPDAGIILVHHTRKLSKKQVDEDPFQALSGAGALRGYYSSGMILFRPDETRSERKLITELRNGPALAAKIVDKDGGQWIEIDPSSERLIRQEYGEKLDAERLRKRDVILQVLFEEALGGRVYTATQFAERFENRAGLGGRSTIAERVSVLTTKGYIKYFRNPEDHDLPPLPRTRYGYLCVEGMQLGEAEDVVDEETGEVFQSVHQLLPTHYKCHQSGAVLEVESPHNWVYHDEEIDHE